MKRWRVAFLLVLLAALPILFHWNRSAALLEDSDTKGILQAIRQADDPLKWFRGDWPIANHFYRPIVSLVFEADNAVWHNDASGYGLTNVLLCFGCVLLLFWALREITDRPWPSAGGAAIFAFWHGNSALLLSDAANYAAWTTLAVGLWRHRSAWRIYLPAFLTLLALSYELLPIRPLEARMIDWIPGRTASTMTAFALIAIAAYARFERLRTPPAGPQAVTPETPPATRSTEAASTPGMPWPWAVVALVATALALGTYEQAVMLPAVLLVVEIAMRSGGRRGKGGTAPGSGWPVHTVAWGLLFGYLALRWALLPHDASGYQRQQFSSTRTAIWTEMEYVFPPLAGFFGLPAFFNDGVYMLFNTGPTGPYATLYRLVVVGRGYWEARREPTLVLLGWLGSAVAFLPMAWFKLFEHYHYWPMAMRSALVVALGAVSLRLMASVWSPPAWPAPPRFRPAPGSLPHP